MFLHHHHHPHLFIVVTGPLDLLQQVSQVRSNGDVVLPGPQLLVEVFVVAGVLL